MLTILGDPQKGYPVIHIAGTKGKGSTGALIDSVLRRAGYRVGFYTSPHLVTVRERIRIDGRLVSKREFARYLQTIARIPCDIRLGDRLAFRTVFEHLTAAALLAFAYKKVDIALIETGLGGRLDATVVLDPILSVITPIGLDHTAILGDTLSQIAAEKAHIIKPGIPAISSPQHREAISEIVRRADLVGAPLSFAAGRSEFKRLTSTPRRTVIKTSRKWLGMTEIEVRLAGDFQLDNVSVALSVFEHLREKGFNISAEAVTEGMKRVQWFGRMQYYPSRPPMIIDGAHNVLAVKMVKQALLNILPGKSWRVVFAANKGKPKREMLNELADIASRFYLAPLQFPKSITAEGLVEAAQQVASISTICPDVPEALHTAQREADVGDMILVVGSLYLVGEVLRNLRGLPPPPADGGIDWRV